MRQDNSRRYRKGLRRTVWDSAVLSTAAAVVFGGLCSVGTAMLTSALSYFVIGSVQLEGLFSGAALAVGGAAGAYLYGHYRRTHGLLGGLRCGAVMYLAVSLLGLVILGAPADIKKLLLLSIAGAAGGVGGVNTRPPSH